MDLTIRDLGELDHTNNESYRKVERFTNAKGVRKVRAAPGGIIDDDERQWAERVA